MFVLLPPSYVHHLGGSLIQFSAELMKIDLSIFFVAKLWTSSRREPIPIFSGINKKICLSFVAKLWISSRRESNPIFSVETIKRFIIFLLPSCEFQLGGSPIHFLGWHNKKDLSIFLLPSPESYLGGSPIHFLGWHNKKDLSIFLLPSPESYLGGSPILFSADA